MPDHKQNPGRRSRKPSLEFWLWLGVIGLVAIYGGYLVLWVPPIESVAPLSRLENR